jgi:hypothetical protein
MSSTPALIVNDTTFHLTSTFDWKKNTTSLKIIESHEKTPNWHFWAAIFEDFEVVSRHIRDVFDPISIWISSYHQYYYCPRLWKVQTSLFTCSFLELVALNLIVVNRFCCYCCCFWTEVKKNHISRSFFVHFFFESVLHLKKLYIFLLSHQVNISKMECL